MVSVANAPATSAKPVIAAGSATAIRRSWPVRAPINGSIACASASASASTNAKWPSSTVIGGSLAPGVGGRCASFRLPYALFLQPLGHFPRHVVLVVLGEHAVGDEDAVRAEAALGHNPRPVAEQVWQDARVADLDGVLRIGNGKRDLQPLPARNRSVLDETAQADALPRRDRGLPKVEIGRASCRERVEIWGVAES